MEERSLSSLGERHTAMISISGPSPPLLWRTPPPPPPPLPPHLLPHKQSNPRLSSPFIVARTTTPASNPLNFSCVNLRLSLLLALSSQAAIQTQRTLQNLTSEAVKYVNPRRRDARNLEEALMTVPDLETIPYRVLRRERDYEIREVESYVVAEIIMPGNRGFDLYGSSQGFNTLAAYLFGKNKRREEMDMTTPVVVSRSQAKGEEMDMTTPVITKQTADQGQWQMAFVMPSKYDDDLPMPLDDAVKIRRISPKIVAVTAFSGYVTDDIMKQKERQLRDALRTDAQFRPKELAQVEVAQFNPPFTPPFLRRNEIALEVVRIEDT